MKRFTLALWFSVFACAPTHAAETIAIEVGSGIHNIQGADAVFLRYAEDTRTQWIAGENFYEWSLGNWDGRSRNTALGIAFGTRGSRERFHVDASFGIAYLDNTTKVSGTHQQFIVRLGAGIAVGRGDLGLFVTHYSNAKPLFGWSGPNAGYDFVTLQFAYPLK